MLSCLIHYKLRVIEMMLQVQVIEFRCTKNVWHNAIGVYIKKSYLIFS